MQFVTLISPKNVPEQNRVKSIADLFFIEFKKGLLEFSAPTGGSYGTENYEKS
jgi:hypothetical protein